MGRRARGQYLIYIVFFVLCILLYLRLTTVNEGFEEKLVSKGIILEIIGGLGNQLYTYAAGKRIQKSLGTPLFMVFATDKNPHSDKDYRAILFKDCTAIERNDPRMSDKIDARVQDKFWDPWSPDSIPSTNQYVFLPQQWYQDFPSIQSEIPEVRESVLKILKGLYPDTVMESEAAFIHVRRGDYTDKGNDVYLLDMDYYNKALEAMNGSPVETYYIFSNDVAWCKQQSWNTAKSIHYIDEPDELKTLYMMSLCKAGAIISNSTFSSWGAFLGPYSASGKIIYPSKWLYGASTDFPTDWVKI